MKVVEYYYDSEIGDTVCVAFMDMDPKIKGQAIYSVPDNRFVIYINTIHSIETQHEAFLHERDHILNGDFEKEDVQQIELEAHGIEQPDPESVTDTRDRSRAEEAYQKMIRSMERKRKKLLQEMEKEKKYIEERNKLLAQIGRELAYEEREDEFGHPVRVLVERKI